MSDDITPAVKRAAQGIGDATNTSGELWIDEAYMSLTAALDDLDDLARILRGTDPKAWLTVDPDTKARWTVEARRVRTALLGADS